MPSQEDKKWDYRNEIKKPLKAGTLLLAQPFMDDPNFIRAACLIVNHIKEEGTFGFILNQKSEYKLSQIINSPLEIDFDVYIGGPVGMDTLFFLHDNKHNINGAKKITDEIYWNGDFEQLLLKIELGIISSSEVFFFIGYSGWTKGQLRKEIIENTWILRNDPSFKLYKNYQQNLWQNTLKEMEGIYKDFAYYPIDINLN